MHATMKNQCLGESECDPVILSLATHAQSLSLPLAPKQQYSQFQDMFVENQRVALNKCIQKIANHPSLRDNPDLKLFLESDNFVLDVSDSICEQWS